jgi:signal transduction histidine kinase
VQISNSLDLGSTLAELTLYDIIIEYDHPSGEVAKVFESNPLLPGIIVKQKGAFVGMISRRRFFENVITNRSIELFARQPLLMFYRFQHTAILILDIHTPILVAVKQTLQRIPELIYEPIVVQTEMGEHKILDVHQLILAQLKIHEIATLAMRESQTQLRMQAQQLEMALNELQRTQSQLIQTEKMSSLGQLVAGIAHEINNPISFIYGNLPHAQSYIKDLLKMLAVYHKYTQGISEVEDTATDIELDYLIEDLPKLLNSMKDGAERIRQIVLSLRNFCRLDEAQMKRVNIHDGIDNTIMLLDSRLKNQTSRPAIKLFKEYGNLPLVECYPGQLNQVFMNILSNAIQALDEKMKPEIPDNFIPTIWIKTEVITQVGNYHPKSVLILIKDNAKGITESVRQRLFDPFFTTKPVGQGTGLGLSISYEIVVNQHGGEIKCHSEVGTGSEFSIEIPIFQSDLPAMISGLV